MDPAGDILELRRLLRRLGLGPVAALVVAGPRQNHFSAYGKPAHWPGMWDEGEREDWRRCFESHDR